MRAERVIVVSLQKSGTHLIAELVLALGYDVIGMVRLGPEDESPVGTVLSRTASAAAIRRRTLDGIRDVAFPPAVGRALELGLRLGLPGTARAIDAGMQRLFWAWATRLGMPVHSRYGYARARSLGDPDAARLMSARFRRTPTNLCWFLHEAPLSRVDGAFIREWSRSGKPAILLNCRDPRDILVSAVHYLTARSKAQRVGRFAEYAVQRRVLRGLPDDEARYLHALLDPSFPGRRDLAESLWLLRHPEVCTVRFEDLVGAAGGGSDERRDATVARVMRHLGCDGDAAAIAAGLYNPDAFSFRRGQIGEWREAFTPAVREAFSREHGELLAAYGYAAG